MMQWGILKKRNLILLSTLALLLIYQACTETPESNDSEATLLESGLHERSLKFQNLNRTYRLHVPSGINDMSKAPLVFVFHGGKGSGEKVEASSGFHILGEANTFYTLYPDGIGTNWNDGRGTTDAELQGVDDVGFITKLVEELTNDKQLRIDLSRVFVTGPSNGGMFTYRLICDASNIFRAAAPVIANIPTNYIASCNPPQQISVLTINGLSDPLIPFDGGETGGDGGYVESYDDSISKLIALNGCDGSFSTEALPIIVADGTSVEKRTYSNCTSPEQLISYFATNAGHIWYPNDANFPGLTGNTTKNMDNTQVIWDFFSQF